MSGAPQSCDRCPALCASRTQVVNSRGSGKRLFVVAQNPGPEEDEQGKCLVGRSGHVLAALLRLAEIPVEDCRFGNAVRCYSAGNRTPKKDEIDNCRPFLEEEIRETAPDLIVAVGAVALESLYGKVPLGTVAGQTLYWQDMTIEEGAYPTPLLPTYHPAAVMRNWALAPLVLAHFEKARRILQGGQEQAELGNYSVIRSLDDLIEAVPLLLHPPQGFLSIDVETAAFEGPATEWKDAEILMLSFSVEPGQGYALPILGQAITALDFWDGCYPDVIEAIGKILSSPVPKALQNGSFDIRFLERAADQSWVTAATSFGWRVENLRHDTMLLHKALHEEMPKESKPNELTRLNSLYLNMPDYWEEGRAKSRSKAHLELLDNEMLWPDGAADADAVSRLVPLFRRELEEEGMGWVMDNITIPMVRACQNMTERGILIDREYFDRLDAYYDEQIQECERELFSHAGDFNPDSPQQVQEVLHKRLGLPKTGRKTGGAKECQACIDGQECVKHDATDKAALAELLDRTGHPFVEAFIRYRELSKLKGTYLKGSRKKLQEGVLGGFAVHIRPDNRIHAEFKVGGAETGRGSASNPPVQTPPKEVKIEEWGEEDAFRTSITAPEGHVLMEADDSQLEVWTSAYLAEDEDFLDVLMSGVDVHTHVARRIEWPHLTRLSQPFPLDPDLNDTDWQALHGDLRRRGKDLVFGCVPMDTEALTPDGWKFYDDISRGDLVMAYDPEERQMRWTPVELKVKYDDAPLVRLENEYFKATTTPDHRWYSRRRTSDGKNKLFVEGFRRTSELSTEDSLILSAPESGTIGLELSLEECELLGWWYGDGYGWQSPLTGNTSQAGGRRRKTEMLITQSKRVGVVRLRAILAATHPDYSEYGPNNNGCRTFRLRSFYARDLWERARIDDGPERLVLQLNSDQRKAFRRGIEGAEGSVHLSGYATTEKVVIGQNEGPVLDAIRLLLFLEGDLPSTSLNDTRGNAANYKVRPCKPYVTGQRLKKRDVPGRFPVWCIKTKFGTWVMRQGNRMMITGNSQYGLTPEGVQERMGCDEEEAKRVLDLYFNLRPKLRDYIDWIGQTILSGEPLTTPFGRRFHFPQIPILQAAQQGAGRWMWRVCQNEIKATVREGINRPTQSSGSDLFSLQHLWTEHTPILEGRMRPNLAIHDSVIGEALAPGQEFVIETAWKIKEHWQRIAKDTVLPSGKRLGWEIPVAVAWGPNFGHLDSKITARGDLIIDGEPAQSVA